MKNKSNFQVKKAEDSSGFLLWQVTTLWQREIKHALKMVDLSHSEFVILASLLWFKEQKVIVDLIAQYTFEDNKFLDYSRIAIDIVDKLKNEKYRLLEEAILGIGRMILEKYPQIENLELKLTKPDIMPNCTVSLSKIWDNNRLID